MTADPADPAELLTSWLPADADPMRPLMTLSTVDANGWPDARTVLLSSWDRDGFCFHTDSRSAKIAQVDATGRAALTLHFPEQARQLVVQGTVEQLTPEVDAGAYARRAPYLRVLAWLNTDDFAARPTAERLDAWSAMLADESILDPPGTWTGRRVRPTRLRFWSGDPDTASRRVEYAARPDGGWATAVHRAG